ncbi:BTAD domain-containing putative transcriptional regulator [Nonomuraea sp. PA05]|uniref:AfsR/SARP family transcriptional regulator n=1 Tax=Nonomuraea sp. PA05 TaxID=2604466 RepID=UPI0016522E4E|nr:BTAD domain-containing putative transcriptional regulator [Nonomuraea sp. PA05]
MSMEINLLGPLEVTVDGVPVRLAGARRVGVLARLALSAGQVVSSERMAADVWGGSPVSTVGKQLHIVISKLREALPGQVIATVPGGYRLDLPLEHLDVHRFSQLTRRARATRDAAAATGLYERALALWRGEALHGMGEVWARIEAARLEQERLTALEDCVDLRLSIGDHHAVLSELTAHVEAHPLRERPRAQLMLALYRAARPAEALALYQETRRAMADELGIEPGAELRRLQRAVLAGDPALDLAPDLGPDPDSGPGSGSGSAGVRVVPAELPADTPAFTARTAEITWLDKVLADAAPGSPAPADVAPGFAAPADVAPGFAAPADAAPGSSALANSVPGSSALARATPRSPVIAAIDGPGGIGKSALAIHAAHAAMDRFPGGVLYVDLHGATAGLPPADPLQVLGRLLRSLGVDGAAVPSTMEEATANYRSITATRQVLVLLDNALDASQVRPLVPAGPGCAVIVTSRRRLASLDGAEHLHLTGLDDHDATALLARVTGGRRVQAEPAEADRIAALCGGLPLALRILAARLAARPDWTLSYLAGRLADATSRLDVLSHADLAVRTAIAVSHHHLREEPAGQDAARLFTLLGLLDTPTHTTAATAALTDWPAHRAEAALDRLLDARLLEPAGLDRHRMHDLIRLYAREQAALDHPEPERRAAVRRAFHHYLAGAKSASLLLDPSSAHALADYDGDRPGVALATAQEADHWTDQESDNLLAAAYQAASVQDDPRTAIGLACALYWPFARRCLDRELIDLHTRTLEIAVASGDLAAQGLEHHLLGDRNQAMGRFSVSAEHLEQALVCWERADRPRRMMSTYNGLGITYAQLRRYDDALAAMENGQALAEAGALPDLQAIFLSNRAVIYDKLGRLDEAIATARASLAIWQELDNPARKGLAHDTLAHAHRSAGQLGEAESAYRQAIALQEEGGHHFGVATSAWGLGQTCHDLGRHDEAWQWWRRSLDILHDVGLLTREQVDQHLAQTVPDTPAPILNVL